MGDMIFPTGYRCGMMKRQKKTLCTKCFKDSGHKNIYEFENCGHKNSELQLQTFQSDLIPADSTNIKSKNQHDRSELQLIQNILLWESQVNTTSDLCASTISMTTSLAHINFS